MISEFHSQLQASSCSIFATGGGFDAATARELAAGVTITITANGTELVKSTAVNCPCPSPSAIRYMYKQLDFER
jgi:hypothetical protein